MCDAETIVFQSGYLIRNWDGSVLATTRFAMPLHATEAIINQVLDRRDFFALAIRQHAIGISSVPGERDEDKGVCKGQADCVILCQVPAQGSVATQTQL